MSVPLLGAALAALVVLVIVLASDSGDCRQGPAWVGVLVWGCLVVGAGAAFLSPIVGGNLRGWRAIGSIVLGMVLAAAWIFAGFVAALYFAGRAGCFE